MAFGLAHRVPIHFEERAPGVGRMQLHAVKRLALVFPRDAHVERGGAGFARELSVVRIALADDHVAAVATPALEVTSGGGIFFDRRDHFEEVAADRHQRILKPEGRDRGVHEADVDREDRLEVIDDWRELFRYHADLTKSYRHAILPEREFPRRRNSN